MFLFGLLDLLAMAAVEYVLFKFGQLLRGVNRR